MGARRQAREVALQLAYMCDALGSWDRDSVEFSLDHFGIPRGARPYALSLIHGVIGNLASLDSQISRASEHWSLSRMSRVDRCLLRLAAYEMTYLEDIPASVAINEAIEIAKRFGSKDSPMFINGVLDRVASSLKKVDLRKVEVTLERPNQEPDTTEAKLPEPTAAIELVGRNKA